MEEHAPPWGVGDQIQIPLDLEPAEVLPDAGTGEPGQYPELAGREPTPGWDQGVPLEPGVLPPPQEGEKLVG